MAEASPKKHAVINAPAPKPASAKQSPAPKPASAKPSPAPSRSASSRRPTLRRAATSGITLKATNTFMQDFALIKGALRTYGRGIVHPRTTPWLGYWDAMSFFCLFYTALVTPFEVCLLQPINVYDMWAADTQDGRMLRKHSRAFNNALAVTSLTVPQAIAPPGRGGWQPTFTMQGRMYSAMGPLGHADGEDPQFAQLYTIDPQHEGGTAEEFRVKSVGFGRALKTNAEKDR